MLRPDNIVLPDGASALSFLVHAQLQAGAVIHLLPDTTKKQEKGSLQDYPVLRCPVLLHLVSEGPPILRCSRSAHHQLCDQAIGSWHAEKPMTCSNSWQRLTTNLKALDIYSGQSVHSTRRRHMIHKQQHLHESHKEVADAAMCNEKNAEYDIDVHRPTSLRSD